ncbi:DUF389 domain-containing protein [Nakamurella lactea]|uniref:DUF389 domain-containing protein n=1 Tax=Nakamurella lactea TaxID=459515 RepID=UPI00040305FD|nr:DUF389 domain-containing protein [Nakamurella lactea]
MVGTDDVARMRSQLFFEGDDAGRRISRFWLLLVLAAIIAGAGVAGDSTATVIGAMIVAPLMSPILGIVLAMVLNNRRNLLRCLATVVAGVVVVILIGFLVGLAKVEPVTAATNSQVAARISPKLIDLVAALATGAVGSIALLRSDISDTLPGVAIAISLVPPLSVVGMTLESGAPAEAGGALLLFLANVSAIMATALAVMAGYGLLGSRMTAKGKTRRWRRPGVLVIAALAVIVAVPLVLTSIRLAQSTTATDKVSQVASAWTETKGWTVVSVTPTAEGYSIRAIGPLPIPSSADLSSALDSAGLSGTIVQVELIPEVRQQLRPGG